MNETINIQDILEVLEHNSIPLEKQIEVLEVLSLALYTRDHPNNPSGILDHKIQLLRQLIEDAQPDTIEATNIPCVKACPEQSEGSPPCVKVKSVAILELLKKMNAGTAHNDMSKISKLIAFLTGNSYDRIYNEMRKGISLTNYHTKDITEINKIFSELNIPIAISPEGANNH